MKNKKFRDKRKQIILTLLGKPYKKGNNVSMESRNRLRLELRVLELEDIVEKLTHKQSSISDEDILL